MTKNNGNKSLTAKTVQLVSFAIFFIAVISITGCGSVVNNSIERNSTSILKAMNDKAILAASFSFHFPGGIGKKIEFHPQLTLFNANEKPIKLSSDTFNPFKNNNTIMYYEIEPGRHNIAGLSCAFTLGDWLNAQDHEIFGPFENAGIGNLEELWEIISQFPNHKTMDFEKGKLYYLGDFDYYCDRRAGILHGKKVFKYRIQFPKVEDRFTDAQKDLQEIMGDSKVTMINAFHPYYDIKKP